MTSLLPTSPTARVESGHCIRTIGTSTKARGDTLGPTQPLSRLRGPLFARLRHRHRCRSGTMGGLQLDVSDRQRTVRVRRSVEAHRRYAPPTYDILLTAFGWGVWSSAGRARNLRLAGAFLIGIAVVGLFGPPFASMHLRGVPGTLGDTMHISHDGDRALHSARDRVRGDGARKTVPPLFDRDTPAARRVRHLGGLGWSTDGGPVANAVARVTERINIGSYLLWVGVLAVALFATIPVRRLVYRSPGCSNTVFRPRGRWRSTPSIARPSTWQP